MVLLVGTALVVKARKSQDDGLVLGAVSNGAGPDFVNPLFGRHQREIGFDNPRYDYLSTVTV